MPYLASGYLTPDYFEGDSNVIDLTIEATSEVIISKPPIAIGLFCIAAKATVDISSNKNIVPDIELLINCTSDLLTNPCTNTLDCLFKMNEMLSGDWLIAEDVAPLFRTKEYHYDV